MMTDRNREYGNVLFIILIGVALFGALSFVVSGMMRGGSGTGNIVSEEKAELYANEILDYARGLRRTIKELQISNRCSDTEISFENDVISGYENANAPSDNSCHVFHPDGGGLSYQLPPDEWLDTNFSANSRYKEWYVPDAGCVVGIGTGGTTENNCASDASEVELTVFLFYIKAEIANSIAEKLNIPTNSGTLYTDYNSVVGGSHPRFDGTYNASAGLDRDQLSGYFSGAFLGNSASSRPPEGSSNFYQVLIAR